MDIYAINEAIDRLENDDTTMENIADLANLYVVRDNLNNNVVKAELSDILPAYSEYIEIKKQYQMREISEGAVIKSLKFTCTEIEEFIHTLYNCTDMNKERKCIKDMINRISTDFSNK